jgi:tripartite-type tricarboxylate transporter receptor subunit TctC
VKDFMPMKRIALVVLAAFACCFAGMQPAAAQDFYRGKTLTILVGFTPGGGFDANARLLARHIARHIPGTPDVIVQNMPGAGSATSVLYLDANAPKDGTLIDIFNFGLIGDALFQPNKTKMDFRNYAWIGSIAEDLSVCYVWAAIGVKTLADMKQRGNFHFGLTAVGASEDINTRILKNIFGIDIHQVSGYPGSAEERLSIERGELDGGCGAWSSIPEDWVTGGKISPMARSGATRPPDLPADVPYYVDIAPSPRAGQVARLLVADGDIGRPFIASKSVPPDRIAILQDAFAATMKDPDFIADLQKARLPFSPKTGAEALKTVQEIYAAPPDIVAEARKVLEE